MLAKKVTAYFYRNREKQFRKFFTKNDKNSVVYCSNVKSLVDDLKPNIYKDDEWRLFIDSSTRSLKAVLLHIGNILAPIQIPIAHSTKLKVTYENFEIVLYSKYNTNTINSAFKLSATATSHQIRSHETIHMTKLWTKRVIVFST